MVWGMDVDWRFVLPLVVALLLLGRWLLERCAHMVLQRGWGEVSREFARVVAFGLLLYSMMQDLQSPDRWLGLYWLLVGCWFYMNNRVTSGEKGG